MYAANITLFFLIDQYLTVFLLIPNDFKDQTTEKRSKLNKNDQNRSK